ncbi:unnamed protein product [Notodromas monacha]|uniref:RNA helicase n=1 Tax=Notodromas monacha TaxID=399045 RepID=A0A7R9GCQ6_9CRUS|nr:unnamed protein product [Notodromas monacha]CAG0917707.1 unnamed protein product [Notodromas monacha]
MSGWKPPLPRPPSNTSSSGYALGGSAIRPPAVYHTKGYSAASTMQRFVAAGASSSAVRRKPVTEDEYFDDDDEDSKQTSSSAPYKPNPGSPGYKEDDDDGEDDEEDPLDAFMAGIEKEVKGDSSNKHTSDSKSSAKSIKGIRDDIEGEDDEESYYRYIKENPQAGKNDDESDEEVEYDEFGEPIVKRKKYIDPLPAVNHSEIEYKPYTKNFYEEHPDIEKLSENEVEELRHKLGVKVNGASPPKPVSSFAHFGLDKHTMATIRKQEFTKPTAIQAQAVPAGLAGRDLIGIAKTGSGKTAAFIWPMLPHILDQEPLAPGDGPIALILAPTRELSLQIYNEARKYGKVFGLRIACCYGGGSKWEQSISLEAGVEVIVATPGRMIDLVKSGATNLRRVTYLVLDEADRMFDLGFEPQVRSICDHVRPDRQCLMFSATFKKKVEKLARHALVDPLRIIDADATRGGGSGVNEDITQIVQTFSGVVGAKWAWLTSHIVEFTSVGSLLIFVTKKLNAEELSKNLEISGYTNVLLHGDMDQADRNQVISAFRAGKANIMVATDVAARGLDIPSIRTVVNYDVARDPDTHVHRIGRTGRAGVKGTAYTLVDREKDKEFAGHLVRNLEAVGQQVPEDLLSLANQSHWFRKSRFKGGKGKRMNDGAGLGFKERPGLGSNVPKSSTSVTSTVSSGQGPLGEAVANTVGPGSAGRLAAMKQAFKSQYQSYFKSSAPLNAPTQTGSTPTSSTPNQDGEGQSRRKRSLSRNAGKFGTYDFLRMTSQFVIDFGIPVSPTASTIVEEDVAALPDTDPSQEQISRDGVRWVAPRFEPDSPTPADESTTPSNAAVAAWNNLLAEDDGAPALGPVISPTLASLIKRSSQEIPNLERYKTRLEALKTPQNCQLSVPRVPDVVWATMSRTARQKDCVLREIATDLIAGISGMACAVGARDQIQNPRQFGIAMQLELSATAKHCAELEEQQKQTGDKPLLIAYAWLKMLACLLPKIENFRKASIGPYFGVAWKGFNDPIANARRSRTGAAGQDTVFGEWNVTFDHLTDPAVARHNTRTSATHPARANSGFSAPNPDSSSRPFRRRVQPYARQAVPQITPSSSSSSPPTSQQSQPVTGHWLWEHGPGQTNAEL